MLQNSSIMQTAEPSRTAWAAAHHRAAHQLLEHGRIFADPLAVRILGDAPETIIRYAEEHPSGRRMRLFIALRSRFAEDCLAAAVERGVTQLVVLGAGLDTYAYRGAMRHRLRIFEVDHPATQAWKRQRLAEAAIAPSEGLVYAPVDFERQTLPAGLADAGFDPSQPTFFTWLGVVPYLTEDAVWSTLSFIAALPAAQVVFDYGNPPASLSPEMRARHERGAERVAGLGEPWITSFDSEQLRARLLALGFAEAEDLGPPRIVARYFPYRPAPHPNGGHIVRAGFKLPPAANWDNKKVPALSFPEARHVVLTQVRAQHPAPPTEEVELCAAAGRVLAHDVAADRDSPALARSVRDGYAVRAADLPGQLRVIGEVRAGERFTGEVAPGEAVEIMTGAPIPAGADAVVMVEHTRREGDRVHYENAVQPGQFINPQGCEAAAGEVVLHSGKRLDYTDIAMLAAFGRTRIAAYRKPVAAIVATGDEIVEVGQRPEDFQIRNSNA